MKWLTLALLVCSCSQAQLKRCATKATEPDLFVCKEDVQGVYKKCEKPVDLYHCENPQ